MEKDNYSTYVISLKYPDKLLNLLRKNSLNPILFRGIDGKTCSNDIIKQNFTKLYNIFGPKSSIGCALSHFYVWKTFLASNKKYAIIFEDDIILNRNTSNLNHTIQNYVSQTPKAFDMLYLGCFGSENTPNFFTIIMKLLGISSEYKYINKHVEKPQVALAMHAYVLSKRGAKKLVKYLRGNIHNHIDYCIQTLYAEGILDNYLTIPRLIYQSSTDTTMSNNVSNTHPILLNHILSNYYIDTHVKASYITTLSIFRFGSYNITISNVILTITVIICILYKIDPFYIFLSLFLLSLPDLFKPREEFSSK